MSGFHKKVQREFIFLEDLYISLSTFTYAYAYAFALNVYLHERRIHYKKERPDVTFLYVYDMILPIIKCLHVGEQMPRHAKSSLQVSSGPHFGTLRPACALPGYHFAFG